MLIFHNGCLLKESEEMKRLTVMIKPTNSCNLRCSYCYHSKYEYSKDVMNIRVFRALVEKVIGCYEELHFIWHGGEPLLAGECFYKSIIEIEKSYADRLKITNSMQTNGTLLTPNFANLLIDNGFQIGFSFDGTTNDKTRGRTCDTLAAMELVRQKGKRIGAIKVMLGDDLKEENIIATYDYFNEKKIDIKLNPLFRCELVEEEELLSPQEYADAIIKLFEHWRMDKDSDIRIDPIENYLALFNGGRRDCSNASCLTRFLSIDYAGDIYPCSRYFDREYCLGNIMSFATISDAFQSEGFKKILCAAVERRNDCLEECAYFSACQGGCNHDAMIEGKLTTNGFFSCVVFKKLYPYFDEIIKSGALEKSENPRLRKCMEPSEQGVIKIDT